MLEALDIYKAYKKSPYLSFKHSAYFQVYEELLSKYRGKDITFVEVGVLNGGSLFMWREFFGPQVRIIGLDFNPLAKRWEEDGFEIHIGSQSNPEFWDTFYKSVGMIDVLLDDGGHTNEQQIVTTYHSIPFINDDIKKSLFKEAVYSVSFYDSIVSFSIDRKKCFISSWTSNNGQSFEAEDYRHHDSLARRTNEFLIKTFRVIGIKFSMGKLLNAIEKPLVKKRLKKYFE